MQLQFYKYQGTGNDFVLFDNRDQSVKLSNKEVEFLCDRRFGIGADGLILLENAEGYDFKMVYYNSDGNESSMCGNGGRCIARFAFDLGIPGDIYRFIAIDGEHLATNKDGLISLKMIDVERYEEYDDAIFIDTGSPHYVEFLDDVKGIEILKRAREVRYSERYADEGVNVNYVQKEGLNHLLMRTYERGVEDETYSCGTGVTAAVLASYIKNGFEDQEIMVTTKGGELSLSFEKDESGFKNIWLKGPATFVFKGEISLK